MATASPSLRQVRCQNLRTISYARPAGNILNVAPHPCLGEHGKSPEYGSEGKPSRSTGEARPSMVIGVE